MNSIFLLTVLLGFSSFAFARNQDSFSTSWHCPGENRGDMPETKTVRISYNDQGEIVMKPNIFRMNNVEGFFRRLIRSERLSTNVAGCLQSFMENLRTPLEMYRRDHCQQSINRLCSTTPEVVSASVGGLVRDSAFFRRYGASIPDADLILGATPVQDNVLAEPNRVAPVRRTREEPRGRTAVVARRSEAQQRAELLDLMIDNAEIFSAKNTDDFAHFCPQLANSPGDADLVKFCKGMYTNQSRVLSQMAQLLSSIKGRLISEREVLTAVSCFRDRNDFSELENILRAIDSKNDCDELQPGEFKTGPYLLKRNQDGNYEAIVKADYKFVSGSLTPAAMNEKVNQCMTTLAPYFRSPTGEKLHIKVLTPDQADRELSAYEHPPVREINLHAGSKSTTDTHEHVRGDTANFHDGMGCSTLAHEFLHHIGLWDEYPEVATNVRAGESFAMKDQYACRVVPKTNTIMGNNWPATAAIVPTTISCRCTTADCRKSLGAIKPENSYILDLITSKSGYDFSKLHPKLDCQTKNITGTNWPLPSRRTVLLKQDRGSVEYESRQAYVPEVGPNAGKYMVDRYKYTCTCNGNTECEERLAREIPQLDGNQPMIGCPFHMESLSPNQYSGENKLAVGGRTRVDGDVLHIVTQPSSSASLLAPNHFAKILYRNCSTGPVADYNLCSSFAYIPKSDPTCSTKPAACSDDGHYLGLGVSR